MSGIFKEQQVLLELELAILHEGKGVWMGIGARTVPGQEKNVKELNQASHLCL